MMTYRYFGFAAFALLGLGAAWTERGHAGEPLSLRDQMRAFERPPIWEYVWRGEINAELTEDRLKDWKRMGFTGFQKRHAPFGGRHFEHGELTTIGRLERYPAYYEDDAGERQKLSTLFGDMAHPDGPGHIVDWIAKHIGVEGNNLFHVNDTYLLLTGDEYDLHYGRRPVKFRWAGEAHAAAWRAFLARDYGDASPGEDTNGDDRTYNAQAVDPIEGWDAARPPAFENRFDEPYVWETYRRFLVELNHGFFESIADQARKRGMSIALALSSHGSVFYPGGPPSAFGGDPYMQGLRSAALIQEAVFPDWPTQAIGHSFFNRYSREYGKPVFAWSWFWPGARHRTHEQFMDGVDVVDRQFARIFPNDVHGLLYWTYANNVKNFPQTERIAFWHHWYREHWPMLRDSRPAQPRVTVLFPKRAPDFYLSYDYPKQDFAFTVQALIDLQVPFTCIGEYELEEGKGLDGIDLLVIASADRISRKAADEIDQFIASGGKVWSNSDSLATDIGGKPLGLLEKRFGVHLAHKYKRRGNESALSLAEEAWARGEAGATLPERTPYGARQSAFDMDSPQWIDLAGHGWSTPRLRTVNEVVTADVLAGGRVLGRYRGQPVIVQTDHTLWVGTRVGADLCAALPRWFLNLAYEPIPDDWPELSNTVQGRAPYAALVDRAVEMAGIERPAEVFHTNNVRANRIEIGLRELDAGGLLVILSDRDIRNESNEAAYTYHLRVRGEPASHEAWDLLKGQPLARVANDAFSVDVPVHRVAYIVIAPPDVTAAAVARQARVDGMDLAVKPYRHGPRGGPTEPPVPVIENTGARVEAELPANVLAEVVVSVTNPTDRDKLKEPIRLTGNVLLELHPGLPIARVSSDDVTVQWSHRSGDGVLTSQDVIAWQDDLPAGATKQFTLRLHSDDEQPTPSPGFTAQADEKAAIVQLDGRTLFRTNPHGEWHFQNITLPDGTRISLAPMTGFILGLPDLWSDPPTEKVKLRSAEVLDDGPVFKTIRLTFADDADVHGTVADYVVYAAQPDDEVRVYAEVLHRIDEMVDLWQSPRPGLYFDQRTMTGAVLTLEQSRAHVGRSRADAQSWYVDGLDRLSDPSAQEANNFGGWTATQWRDQGMVQVSFRRVQGVRELVQFMAIGLYQYDVEGAEADGLQVLDNQVVRAAFDLFPAHPYATVDMRIPPGTRWRLDTLIALRPSFDEATCREARAAFAAPPKITIDRVTRNQ